MATIQEALEAAVGHHQAGRFDQAKQICAQVIAANPDNAVAWNLYGVVASQKGETAAAIDCIQKAVKLQPNYAEAHNNLGVALERALRLDEAVACYRRALSIRPDLPEALCGLGSVLLRQGKRDEAAASDHQALALRPAFAKELDKRGADLQRQGNIEEAISFHRRALELNPNDFETHDNLGVALQELGRFEEAAQCHRKAIALAADDSHPHFNLAVALQELQSFDDAIASYRRVLTMEPGFFEACLNLAGLCQELRMLDEAERYYSRALELKPGHAEAHWFRSNVRLVQGDFERGLPESEWRWKVGQAEERHTERVLWRGEPLAGRSILLHVEQGFGDTFQWMRYVPLVKERGGTILLECQKRLMNLLSRCVGIDRLTAFGDKPPPTDFHAPLASLPWIFKTTMETIPANVPYLAADPALIAEWHEKLQDVHGFRIGVNWHGREAQGLHLARDIPLDQFASLAEIAGVRLISLQKGTVPDERLPPILDVGPFDEDHGAFADTAAILMNLDLVITSDTSIAHLAGALGVPVWVGLPLVADWRWFLDRSDSPWYPSMRLFRQAKRGNWTSIIADIRAALEHAVSLSTPHSAPRPCL